MELIRLARRRFRPSQPHGEGRGAELRRRRGRCFVWAGITTLSVLTLVFVIATSARAATTAPHQVLALAASVNAVLNNIRNWIMGILAGLATVFLSLGGVRYVMAGGDPGEVEKAKTAFKSAGWGYGLAALAPLVVQILKGIVGA
ncbi:pilin [Streptomyces sp. NPDC091215]|uniref:pilin n=1 Tax=Streptomyces sp. NPDC091215 TaxID=3155192 RepID=UPI003427AD03